MDAKPLRYVSPTKETFPLHEQSMNHISLTNRPRCYAKSPTAQDAFRDCEWADMSLTNEAKWFKFMIWLPCIHSVVFVWLCVSLCWRSCFGFAFLAYFPQLAWGIDRFFLFHIFTMVLYAINVLCMHFHLYVHSPACTPDLKNFHKVIALCLQNELPG